MIGLLVFVAVASAVIWGCIRGSGFAFIFLGVGLLASFVYLLGGGG